MCEGDGNCLQVHNVVIHFNDAELYVGSYDHYLYAIHTFDGSMKWRHPSIRGDVSSFSMCPCSLLPCLQMFARSSLSVNGTELYVASEHEHLYAIYTVDGTTKWSAYTSDPVSVGVWRGRLTPFTLLGAQYTNRKFGQHRNLLRLL